MDIAKTLDALEDKYNVEEPEQKSALIAELLDLHMGFEAPEDINHFLVQASDRFGGIYIPYLFWDKLSMYLENEDERMYLFKLLENFVESDFEAEEQQKMKPLIVVYFSHEKEFETDKIRSLILEKVHPQVKEYFDRLFNFVVKNKKSTEMYLEKFDLLKEVEPNFQLMRLPMPELKKTLAVS